MAKRTPFTSQEERLERLIKNARSELVALKGMVNTARSVVAAQYVKVDDPSSPQIIRVSEGGSLALGSESAMRVIGAVTEEASHTGDTDYTTIGKITVPANSMGPRGFVRISTSWRGTGPGTHVFLIKFGGTNVRAYWLAGTLLMVDMLPTYIWNRGASNSQGAGIYWGAVHVRNSESAFSAAIDTTADVDIELQVQNTDAAGVAYLPFALVEAFYRD